MHFIVRCVFSSRLVPWAMYMKITICLLLLEIVSSTRTSKADRLIRDICDSLQDEKELDLPEDRQWRVVCQELLSSIQERAHDQGNLLHGILI